MALLVAGALGVDECTQHADCYSNGKTCHNCIENNGAYVCVPYCNQCETCDTTNADPAQGQVGVCTGSVWCERSWPGTESRLLREPSSLAPGSLGLERRSVSVRKRTAVERTHSANTWHSGRLVP